MPPQRLLFGARLLFHLLALCPALLLDLALPLKMLWIVAVSVSAFFSLRFPTILELCLVARDRWQLRLASGTVDAELEAWYVQSRLCLLRFKDSGGRGHTVIFLGAGDAPLRRLRVLLRTQAA